MNVLKTCPNTYVDTAFMPISHMKELAGAGFAQRILYGTDAPINQMYYEGMTTSDYIKNNLFEMKQELGEKLFNEIISNQLYK